MLDIFYCEEINDFKDEMKRFARNQYTSSNLIPKLKKFIKQGNGNLTLASNGKKLKNIIRHYGPDNKRTCWNGTDIDQFEKQYLAINTNYENEKKDAINFYKNSFLKYEVEKLRAQKKLLDQIEEEFDL